VDDFNLKPQEIKFKAPVLGRSIEDLGSGVNDSVGTGAGKIEQGLFLNDIVLN
jgi:hypothetical protein